jgi:ribosomal protein L3 glutamine methyltransferase
MVSESPVLNEPRELRTLRDWLRYAVTRFNSAALVFGHGSTNAYDEAAYLLLHTLHLPLDKLEPFLDAQLLPEEHARIAQVLNQRVEQRIPAAYITREAWLGEYQFYVDERAIVPRSFIAELLREGLTPWLVDAGQIGHVLDVCTGSGCLAILAALTFPAAQVDASDVSAAAIEIARRNVGDYGLNERVRLFESDLFAALPPRRYDLIISNPPYVAAAAMATLPPEYLHEPQLALAGGMDGLEHTRQIIEYARAHLNPDGVLVVEIGDNRAVLEAAYPNLAFTWLPVSGGDDLVFLLRYEDLG